MRFHSIELFNIRSIKQLKINSLPENGVFVVHGPNEAGKSTIAEAINTVLNVSYRSKAKDVKAIEPVNESAAPRIILNMSAGPYRFEIDKQFLRTPRALLKITAPRPETLKDSEAESRLASILSEHTDKELFTALVMLQGDDHEGIKAAGIPAVGSALHELGAAGLEDTESADGASSTRLTVGDEQDTALMEHVKTEYLRYFTLKTGKESDELKQARQHYADILHDFEESQDRLQTLESCVQGVALAEDSLKQAKESLPRAYAELTQAQNAMVEINMLSSRVNDVRKDESLLQKDVDHLESAWAKRLKQKQRLQTAEEELRTAQAELTVLTENELLESTKIAQLISERDAFRIQRDECWDKLKQAKTHLGQLQQARSANELAQRIKQLDLLDTRLRELHQSKKELGSVVDQALVDKAEKLERDWHFLTVTRDASAAKLMLTAEQETSVSIAGEEVLVGEDEVAVALAPGTILTFGDVTARFEPGIVDQGVADLDTEVQRLRQEFDDVLASVACEDLSALRARLRAHAELDNDILRAQEERREVLKGEDADALHALWNASGQREVSEYVDDPARLSAAISAAQEEMDDLEQDFEQAAQKEQSAIAALEGWKSRPAQAAVTKAKIRIESLEIRVDEITHDVHSTQSAEGQGVTLEERLASAKNKLHTAKEVTRAAEEKLADAQPDMREAAVAGVEAEIHNLEAQKKDAENKRENLLGRIEANQGVAENALKLTAQLEYAQANLEAVEKRAAAAKLLWEVLNRHQQEARERYAQPFAQRLSRLAERVFGRGAQIELDEELSIESRSFGSEPIPLGDLSGGAKEQLAILSRFAIADLIADSARETVPVIIDDALGSTDSQRLRSMAALFGEVGRKSQVIVLTCEPSRYHRVPGAQLVDIAELKQQLN